MNDANCTLLIKDMHAGMPMELETYSYFSLGKINCAHAVKDCCSATVTLATTLQERNATRASDGGGYLGIIHVQ